MNLTGPWLNRYLLCFAGLFFAACGGSGGGGNNDEGAAGPSGFQTCSGAAPAMGNSGLSVRSLDEVEPNDDVSIAYAVNMPNPAAPEDFVGIIIEGTVHDTTDPTDIFAFALSRSRQVFFKLCESACETLSYDDRFGNPDVLPAWIAYFDVLDAEGKKLLSTKGHNPAENYGDTCIHAGVVVHIAVQANDTLNQVQPYRISAIETGY